MNDIIISEFPFATSIPARTDSFVAIGDGLEVCLPEGAQNGDSWLIDVRPLVVTNHLQTTFLGNDLWVSNTEELLGFVRDNLYQCHNSDFGTYDLKHESRANLDYRFTSIATFYNHIFGISGRTLYWTDLDNFWNWYPTTDSEADFRELEWESEDASALVVLNDVLYIHLPSSIYECTYVGKPSIVRIIKRVTGAGAINQRACVATKNAMFFLGVENFYVWSPDIGLKEIGQEVWKLFLSTAADLDTTWCYHDQRHHEVCWVNNGLIYAFNYLEGHWQKYSAEHLTDHTSSPWKVDFLPINVAATILDSASYNPKGIENLWVGCKGVLRELRAKEGVGRALGMEAPYLETDDFTYGDVHHLKGVDVLVLDAEVTHPWVGFKVSVASKKRVTSPTEWEVVGTWMNGAKQVDFPGKSARALRFRFELVSGLALLDGEVTLTGGQQLDGRFVEKLDGSHTLDGSFKFHEASYFVSLDGQPRYTAEVYAYGERVDLPEKLIGPDK